MNLASFRANWSTTLTGSLMALSGFATFVAGFADQLGKLGALIPEKYRGEILLAGGVATALSTALHGTLSKSASVTGNGTVFNPAKVAQSDGSNTTVAPLILLLLLPALLFTACAQTVLYSPATGKPLAKFQGDMVGSDYAGGGVRWKAPQVSHSAATLAQGSAAAHVIGAIGSAGAGMILAGGTAGFLPQTAGVAAPALTTWFNRPAALQAK